MDASSEINVSNKEEFRVAGGIFPLLLAGLLSLGQVLGMGHPLARILARFVQVLSQNKHNNIEIS